MANTLYPTAEDLTAFLTAARYTLPPDLDLEGAIVGAAEDFERDTLWQPYLSSGVDSPRKFDAPRRKTLFLEAGLLSLTSLTVGVTPASAGTVLVQDTDFFLGPENADQQGYPFEIIEFYSWAFQSAFWFDNYPRSIVVVGPWGRALSLSSSVFQAILCKAADNLLPQLSRYVTNITAGYLIESKQDDVDYKYSSPGKVNSHSWLDIYNEAVKRSRRRSLL